MIYFLKNKKVDVVKIGYTSNIQRRIKQLEQQSKCKLKLLLLMPGNILNEKELHKHFKNCNISGEWFNYSEAVKSYISLNNHYQIKDDDVIVIKFNERLKRSKGNFIFRMRKEYYDQHEEMFINLMGDRSYEVLFGSTVIIKQNGNIKANN